MSKTLNSGAKLAPTTELPKNRNLVVNLRGRISMFTVPRFATAMLA
jgi:hypothetical protein